MFLRWKQSMSEDMLGTECPGVPRFEHQGGSPQVFLCNLARRPPGQPSVLLSWGFLKFSICQLASIGNLVVEKSSWYQWLHMGSK